MNRLVAVGLDAAQWSYVQRLLDAGRLPHLRRLMGEGAHGRLENVLDFRTEQPWMQFISGRPAAETGCWSLIDFDPETYRAFDVVPAPGRPFWTAAPGPTIAFDVPQSTIDHDVEGAVVTAWGATGPFYPRASRPHGLLSEIDATVGPHPAFGRDYGHLWCEPGHLEDLAVALREGAARRVDGLSYLMEKYPNWSVALTVMSEPHSIGHQAWHGVDPDHPLAGDDRARRAGELVDDVHVAVDEALGRLVERLPADVTLAVFALHGMQTSYNEVPGVVLLPELLFRLQFGRTFLASPTRGRIPAGHIEPPEDNTWLMYLRTLAADGRVERLRRDLRVALPPAVLRAKHRLQHRLTGRAPQRFAFGEGRPIAPETDLTPEEIRAAAPGEHWEPGAWYRKYWPRMRAFALPNYSDGHIRLNVEGRERDGFVPRDEFRAACEQVAAEIRSCRDPRTGREVVDDIVVTRADPLDDGPAPDIVVRWSAPVDALEHPTAGVMGPVPYGRTGEHSNEGFAVFRGPGIPSGDLGRFHALDLPPTLLTLAGVEVPDGIAGQSMLTPVAV